MGLGGGVCDQSLHLVCQRQASQDRSPASHGVRAPLGSLTAPPQWPRSAGALTTVSSWEVVERRQERGQGSGNRAPRPSSRGPGHGAPGATAKDASDAL